MTWYGCTAVHRQSHKSKMPFLASPCPSGDASGRSSRCYTLPDQLVKLMRVGDGPV
ncbi:unnamed protein product [Periconia digitata]|uniref:Uncharacterized protein n=1 Tax=Periconia digitata TaxID=1303443 RepID=A0A9W4U9S2_9PLEO|nr:unnamed protein product [Periconia digitata]